MLLNPSLTESKCLIATDFQHTESLFSDFWLYELSRQPPSHPHHLSSFRRSRIQLRWELGPLDVTDAVSPCCQLNSWGGRQTGDGQQCPGLCGWFVWWTSLPGSCCGSILWWTCSRFHLVAGCRWPEDIQCGCCLVQGLVWWWRIWKLSGDGLKMSHEPASYRAQAFITPEWTSSGPTTLWGFTSFTAFRTSFQSVSTEKQWLIKQLKVKIWQ